MKSSLNSILILALVAAACARPDAGKVLRDDQLRAQVFAEVLNNHNYLSQFMDSMRLNGHASMMMANDSAWQTHLFKHGKTESILHELVSRAESDSVTCKVVCSALMDNSRTMRGSVNALKEKGMMDKGCMMDKTSSSGAKATNHKH